MDFPITLDPGLKTPLWRQLAGELRQSIDNGRLKPGEPLPPTRHLAQLLGVSRDTVIRGYEELITMGYASATTGAGTFVNRQLPGTGRMMPAADASASSLERLAARLSAYGERLQDLNVANSTCADYPELNYGAAPADMLPAKQWKEILSRHCHLQEPSRLDYDSELFGHRGLREAIASYLRRSKAINCHPDQIVAFSDSQRGMDLVYRLLIDPGDAVLVENPGYSGARENLLSHGAVLHPVPVDENGLVTDYLRRMPAIPKLAHVTPSHHDPLGTVMSMERRRQLLGWARDRGVFVIEDAFDSDYRYGSPALPTLKGMDDEGLVIYHYSFWKILYPISPAGCVVLPPSLVDVFARAKLLTSRNFPIVEHYALADFITEGHLERHIRKTRAIYARRRQALIFALAQNFRSAVSYFKESASLHLSVRFRLDVPDEQLLSMASQAGLPMVSTRAYYAENPPAGEFLIPFAGLSESRSRTAVEQLAELCRCASGSAAATLPGLTLPTN